MGLGVTGGEKSGVGTGVGDFDSHGSGTGAIDGIATPRKSGITGAWCVEGGMGGVTLEFRGVIVLVDVFAGE